MPNKKYVYSVLYIDSGNDTITKEQMILAPTGKTWFFQPRLQKEVAILYFPDTLGLKKFKAIIPDHKELKITQQEITGGYYNETMFSLHSPRQNQYEVLYYAAFPEMYLPMLSDTSINCFISTRNNADKQRYVSNYTVNRDSLWYDTQSQKEIQNWQVNIVTDVQRLNEYFEALGLDSRCDAVFNELYGYTKMHYTFSNGVKIQFDLVEVKVE